MIEIWGSMQWRISLICYKAQFFVDDRSRTRALPHINSKAALRTGRKTDQAQNAMSVCLRIELHPVKQSAYIASIAVAALGLIFALSLSSAWARIATGVKHVSAAT